MAHPIDRSASPGIAWRLASAWAFALVGLAWAALLNFAGSMQTVPSMSVGQALLATPLPLIAILLVRSAVVRAREGSGPPVGPLRFMPPLALALLALFFGWSLTLGLGLS